MVNTILEIPLDDSEIKGRITKVFHDVELVFKKTLEDAKREGTVSKNKDIDGLASVSQKLQHRGFHDFITLKFNWSGH